MSRNLSCSYSLAHGQSEPQSLLLLFMLTTFPSFQFWLVDTVIKNKTAPTVASSEDYLPTTDSYIPFPPDQPVYFKLSEDQPQETGVKMGMRNGFRFPESRVSYDARLNSAAAEEDDDEEAEQPGVNGEAPLSAGSGSGSGSGSGQFGR